ncbi:RagB/SusD family nutrient uptake outer membrane protein [Pedobacter mendelii]|uniref:Membrane protein n=1 Tax=Pedobacter mendelii TaxID=1908240 RepID=A0ABQ2BLQ8_9SPHI|nr:RagB/SusD family nutrient uptake outer membrane protein [Pedobacter mendelii]GGI29223.1 membrane protein [Pedobacter mendelii]
MKKIFYIAFVFAVIAMGSCKKSDLDYVPQDQLSSNSFWKTEKDATLALNACYGYFSNAYSNAYDDGASDNAYAQYPWESNATPIAAGNINATIDQGYGSRYVYIRRYNYFLDNVSKAPLSVAMMKRYVAEAKVLRAITYYDLARVFGPVPLLKTAYAEPSETAIAPTSEADVINFAISEIQSAVADLNPAIVQSGRITAGAAWAFLARIQLQYQKYADAVVSAEKVKSLGYQLFRKNTLTADDLTDDFSSYLTFANAADKDKFYKGLASYEQQFWAANELDNKELILASQNISNSSYDYGNGLRTLFPSSDLGGWSSITPTQDLVNAYWNKNGDAFTPPAANVRATNYNSGKPNAAYNDEFKNRDTRLYASILFPGTPWGRINAGFSFAWGKGGGNNSVTGYNFKKLVDPSPESSQNEWDGSQDFPIIRYAEVLLAFSEAKNELSGPDATIYAALDDIRTRSGMPAVNQTAINTKEKLRDFIRNERRIELAGEGQRYADIRRWNIAIDVMKTTYDITNSIVQTRVWDNKFMLMPYPQTAIDRNANLKTAQTTKGY